jgi:hypothetical protein
MSPGLGEGNSGAGWWRGTAKSSNALMPSGSKKNPKKSDWVGLKGIERHTLGRENCVSHHELAHLS